MTANKDDTIATLKSGESVMDIISLAKLAAAKTAYYNAPAVKALTPIIVTQPFVMPGLPMTMAVDKYYRMYVGPSFVQDIVDRAEAVSEQAPCATCGATSHHRLAYVAGVIVHEAWHLVRKHSKRFDNTGYRDALRWNVAADLELNDDIVELFNQASNPKLCLPPGCMLPKAFRETPEEARKWASNPSKAAWDRVDTQDDAALQLAWSELDADARTQLTSHKHVTKYGTEIWPLFTDNQMAEDYYILLPSPPPCPIHGSEECDSGEGDSGEGDSGEGDSGEGDSGEGDSGSHNHEGDVVCTCPWHVDHGSGAGGARRSYEKGAPSDGDSGVSEAEGNIISNKVAQNIQEGAKARGTNPAGMDRWANEQLEPARYDWRAELQKACGYGAGRKRGHSRRSFRNFGVLTTATKGRILYPKKHDPVPNVSVVFDTSGSMSHDALVAGMQEVEGILKGAGAKVRFTSVDAEASDLVEVRNITDITLTGGGGTDMRVGISKALETRGLGQAPNLVVVMTDGFTPWPEYPLDSGQCQLIVCLVGDDSADLTSVPDWALGIKITADVEVSGPMV